MHHVRLCLRKFVCQITATCQTLLYSVNMSTLQHSLLCEPVQYLKWHCYTDASWAPEGDYNHQAVAIYLGSNLVAWQSQRHSLVALSSAEAELIASVCHIWGNRLALNLYGQLNEMILSKPPYITYCDNSEVVLLTQQLSASSYQTDICPCEPHGCIT